MDSLVCQETLEQHEPDTQIQGSYHRFNRKKSVHKMLFAVFDDLTADYR